MERIAEQDERRVARPGLDGREARDPPAVRLAADRDLDPVPALAARPVRNDRPEDRYGSFGLLHRQIDRPGIDAPRDEPPDVAGHARGGAAGAVGNVES